MRNQLYMLLWDDQGTTHVNYPLLVATVASMMAVIYTVLNGSGSEVMREAVTDSMTHMAEHFGEDLVGEGAPLRDDPATQGPHTRRLNIGSPALLDVIEGETESANLDRRIRVLLDPNKRTYTLIDMVTGERLLIRPAEGVTSTLESNSKVVLFDEVGYRNVVLDLLRQRAYFLDPLTSQRTSVDLKMLESMRLIEIMHGPATLQQRITGPALVIPSMIARS